jgi:hypothetical protein
VENKNLTKADVEQAVSNGVSKMVGGALIMCGIFWMFENGMWYFAVPALIVAITMGI